MKKKKKGGKKYLSKTTRESIERYKKARAWALSHPYHGGTCSGK